MIGIVYNPPAAADNTYFASSADVLIQVRAVAGALAELGRESVQIPFARDVGAFSEALESAKVDLVLNLCEAVDENPLLHPHPAAVLELLGIPFSGSSAAGLTVTTDKLFTKHLLAAGGIATPAYAACSAGRPLHWPDLNFPVIVKPRFEDASIGIDQDSIFEDRRVLKKKIDGFCKRFGDVLIEEYIPGQEFNLSLLGYPQAAPLPLAEIRFTDFPPDLYPIVGYSAKWDSTSFQYAHTPRTFAHGLDPSLVAAINKTAVACHELFELRDYSRVDMRLDAQGRYYVLEINANPCLSPDAGFAAAAAQAGYSYAEMIGEILACASRRSPAMTLQ